jgi:hypothetical protein
LNVLLIVALTLSAGIASTADATSVRQLQKRASLGDSRAQFWLGIAYERGHGVQADQRKAVKWIQRSAHSGNPDAQNWMGQAYEQGEGVRRDLAEAAHWYSVACQNRPDYGGAGQGCNNLGLLYFYGKGTAQNYALAYLYARMGRNSELASQCAEHMTLSQRENTDRQYDDWLRQHGEGSRSPR